MAANSCSQNALTTGSVSRAVIRCRYRSIAQESQHGHERRARHFQQGQQGVSEDVLQPRAPRVAVELLEGGEHAGGDERTLAGSGHESGLNASGCSRSPASKSTTSFVRRFGIGGQQTLGQVAVRIDEADAAAGGDVGCQQVREQRRFPHAGLAEDRQVPQAVVRQDAEAFVLPAERGRVRGSPDPDGLP